MADIITYPENGIQYYADDASGYLSTRLSGVYSADEDFAVTANGDLTVSVSAGQAWVHPARFRGRSIIMEQPETVTLTAADAVRSRIDRLVLRYDAAARKTSLTVLTGTPDSASPTAPEITRTALVYDLCLAEIRRPAGSTEITAADITDTRADEDVCGVMRDGVTGIPTEQLVAQWQAAQAAQMAQGTEKLDRLEQSIRNLDNGSFYTKQEADRKFGTPYSLPAATVSTLGGVKVGEALDIAPDGTLSAKTLNDKIAAAVAVKSEPRLVWSGKTTIGRRKTQTINVQDGVDYVNLRVTCGADESDFNLTPGMSYETGGLGAGSLTVTVLFSADKKRLECTLTNTLNTVSVVFTGYHYPTLAELVAETQAAQDDADALNLDQDYRLTLLELGVTDDETTETA